MPISIRVNEYLFMSYVGLVASGYELTDKNDYNRQIKVIESAVNKFTNMSYSIEFSPNLLQMPGMADFVKQGDRTVVITTYPTEIAILHEFLHPFISAHRNIISVFLPITNLDKCINTESMITYGYMWDDSEDAKVHALEECFVRGISIGISNMNKQEKAQYCKWSCDSGFLFVSEILKAMEVMGITEDNLGDFIRQILGSGCVK
jgi:hypothetical protein